MLLQKKDARERWKYTFGARSRYQSGKQDTRKKAQSRDSKEKGEKFPVMKKGRKTDHSNILLEPSARVLEIGRRGDGSKYVLGKDRSREIRRGRKENRRELTVAVNLTRRADSTQPACDKGRKGSRGQILLGKTRQNGGRVKKTAP